MPDWTRPLRLALARNGHGSADGDEVVAEAERLLRENGNEGDDRG